VSDLPLVDCPACGSPSLKKLISVAGFRLKGGGWYETDFKRGKQRNVHDSGEGSASTKETAKSGTKDTASSGGPATGSAAGS